MDGESGLTDPYIVYSLRAAWAANSKRITVAVFVVVAFLMIASWVTNSPTHTFNDGTHIKNVYKPEAPSVYVTTAEVFSAWLTENRGSRGVVTSAAIDTGYFSAPVYASSDRLNVTFEWLSRELEEACGKAERTQDNPYGDECQCMSALDLGVLANAMHFEGRTAYNVRIDSESGERTALVSFSDGHKLKNMPLAITVTFRNSRWGKERITLGGGHAWCVKRAVMFITGRS